MNQTRLSFFDVQILIDEGIEKARAPSVCQASVYFKMGCPCEGSERAPVASPALLIAFAKGERTPRRGFLEIGLSSAKGNFRLSERQFRPKLQTQCGDDPEVHRLMQAAADLIDASANA